MQEQTDWHRIVAWSRLAEFAKQYLHKGMRVYIEGRLQYRDWQDQNGVKRFVTDIVANEIQMLESMGNRAEMEEEGPADKDLEIPEDVEPNDDDSVPF
jgi:single-strand DNA-binding protein